MKKYIALILAAMILTLPSCSSGEADGDETEETIVSEAEIEPEIEETEPETEEETVFERPADEEVITYTSLELEKDPVYDRDTGLFVLYFTDHELWYKEDAKCYIGLVSDSEAASVTGTPDMVAYPDMMIDEDDFCGIAIRVDEEIPAGEYFVSVTFDNYIANFDYTIE